MPTIWHNFTNGGLPLMCKIYNEKCKSSVFLVLISLCNIIISAFNLAIGKWIKDIWNRAGKACLMHVHHLHHASSNLMRSNRPLLMVSFETHPVSCSSDILGEFWPVPFACVLYVLTLSLQIWHWPTLQSLALLEGHLDTRGVWWEAQPNDEPIKERKQ